MADATVVPTGANLLRRFIPLMAGVVAVMAVLTDPGTAVENVVAALAVLPFVIWVFRPRWMPPLALVLAVSAAEFVLNRSGGLEATLFLLCIATMVVGVWEPSRLVVAVAGGIAIATPVVAEALYRDGIFTGIWVMGILLPLMLGRAFRSQVELTTKLSAARQELARQAVLDEKRRIARDVHDLVGHGLAAMLLHVTGARHVLRRDIDAADEALADAESVGRRSMQELRSTLAVLRLPDGEVSADAAPVPDVGDITEVVAAAGASGLDVAMRTEGDLEQVDPVVGLSLHRVVEEALANARRHAPRAVTDVVLVVKDEAVTLVIDTVGPLRSAEPADDDGPRYGLIGMRERMAAVGGRFAAGPTSTGWEVRCHAPLVAPDVDDVLQGR
ncbi:MAG TPA: histidine kinase [Acidimicrobiales bacterium]|jgi:signal transduction histidine kinase